jgi:hypothetical protein
VKTIFLLLVLFQIKHFLCDYPLQGAYMLGKFKTGKDWILPLSAHAGVHFLGTLFVSLWFVPFGFAVLLSVTDFAVHFSVDRIKASPNLLGRWKPDNRYFWWALGGDQMAHHLTHYAIIAAIVGAGQ